MGKMMKLKKTKMEWHEMGTSRHNHNNQNINKSNRGGGEANRKKRNTNHKNNNSLMNHTKCLKIMHWNCNSIGLGVTRPK
jgi:hypothetical protein